MRLLAAAVALAGCQSGSGEEPEWSPVARVRILDECGVALDDCRVQVVGERISPSAQQYRILHEELRTDSAGMLSFDAAEGMVFILLLEEKSGLVTSLGPYDRAWFFAGEQTIDLPELRELSGIIHDAADQPYESARVFPFSDAIPHDYWGPLAPAGSWLEEDEDFPWRVEGGTRTGGWAQAVLSFAETGPDGSFRLLTRIIEPELGVLDHDGLPFRFDLPPPSDEPLVLRLPSPVTQTVTVLDERGAPVPAADVLVARASWGDWAVFVPIGRTNERGQATTTTTRREGWGEDAESGVMVLGIPGYSSERDSYNTVRSPGPVRLEPHFPLQVRVRNHEGAPLSGCRFEALTEADWEPGDTLPPSGRTLAGVQELAPGHYQLPGGRSQDEVILVFHDDYLFAMVELERDDWAVLVRAADGTVTGTADLARPVSTSFFVRDPASGRPLRGVHAQLLLSTEAAWSSWTRCECVWTWQAFSSDGFTNSDGHWKSAEVCSLCFTAVSLTHPNGARMVLPLAEVRRDGSIPFRTESRSVSGTLTQLGRTLAGYEVEFTRRIDGDQPSEFRCVTDAAGKYSIVLPMPEQYEISGKPIVDFYMGHYTFRHDAFVDGELLDIALEQEFRLPQGPSGILRGAFSVDGAPAQGAVGIRLGAADPDGEQVGGAAMGCSLFLDDQGAFEVSLPVGEFEIWLGYMTPGAAPAERLRGFIREGEILRLEDLSIH